MYLNKQVNSIIGKHEGDFDESCWSSYILSYHARNKFIQEKLSHNITVQDHSKEKLESSRSLL